MAKSIKTGLQNEEILGKLSLSGSSVITTKNDFGIHIFKQSEIQDGIISSRLTKPYYNEVEIQKAIDTSISELITQDAPIQPATVLKTVYDVAIAEIELRDIQITGLKADISNLESNIQILNSVTQSLRLEMDNQKLLVANSDNQLGQTTTRLETNVTELQNAIQKATSEAIKRVSLTAINDALLKENATLKDTLYGKQAKIDEKAQVTEEFSVKVLNIGDPNFNGLLYRARANQNTEEWINGPVIELKNFSPNPITISFTEKTTDAIENVAPITLKTGEMKQVTLKEKLNWIRDQKPRNGLFTDVGVGDTDYNGNLQVTTTKTNLSVSIKLNKFRGNQ
jgi:hypothetical protein